MNEIRRAQRAGYEFLASWSDLLNQINVYPVADGDTGSNLRVSLAPLRQTNLAPQKVEELLVQAAIGNSGNIAVAFFRLFCQADTLADLADLAERGSRAARDAVADPRPGTMLSVFDQLALLLADQEPGPACLPALRDTVLAGTDQLRALKEAQVVDAGALAIYIFFSAFFSHLARQRDLPDIISQFPDRLTVHQAGAARPRHDFCVDVSLTPAQAAPDNAAIAQLGESVVVLQKNDQIKVHIHTNDPDQLRRKMAKLGHIQHWRHERIANEGSTANQADQPTALHIMTDAAASLPRALAESHQITLLDSYIIHGENSRPESLCQPEQIYAPLKAGERLTTAQASNHERYHHYRNACACFGPTLYLCTGSAFTGNFNTATAWKEEHDPDNLLHVMDSGAASGRLALIALLTARAAGNGMGRADLLALARSLCEQCREYVFIDDLRYLAASGRISRLNGFFGNMLHLKPIISPQAEGVRKMGVVRSRKGQVHFATEVVAAGDECATMLVQYSDNREWVENEVVPLLSRLQPRAEIIMVPLSLTSGVHMGPGTWGVALR